MATYALITVHRTHEDGTVTGAWVQDHVGTLESARQRASATSAANSGTPIAVVRSTSFCTPAEVLNYREKLA